VAIAIRFAAVRKQFGPKLDDIELPIMEYQLHVSILGQHSCSSGFTVGTVYSTPYHESVMELLDL
jgi:hypothetical protein